MLRYKLERYDTCREKVSGEVLTELLTNSLQSCGVNLNKAQAEKALLTFLTELSYMFYEVPDQYIDFPEFAVYRRGDNIKNLISVEAKGEHGGSIQTEKNGKTIREFYQKIYFPKMDITSIVTDYVSGVVSHSSIAEQKANKDIKQLQSLIDEQKNKGD